MTTTPVQQARVQPLWFTDNLAHVHVDDEETFYVIEGVRVESDEAHWLVIATPAGFDEFVRAVADVAPAEELPPAGRPVDPAAMGQAAARFGIELLGPPGTLPA